MDGGYLPSLVELLTYTEETERLAHLIGRSPDSSLEALSHYVAQRTRRRQAPMRGRALNGSGWAEQPIGRFGRPA
jgi:hypothetical protein